MNICNNIDLPKGIGYSRKQLESFKDRDLTQIYEFTLIKNDLDLNKMDMNRREKIIDELEKLYGTGAITFEPDVHNPYKYLTNPEIKALIRERNLPTEKKLNRDQLQELLIQNDKSTNHRYKKDIFKQSMFHISNMIHLILLASVYHIQITKFDEFTAKNLLYIFMVMPKLKNHLEPADLKQFPYLQQIPVEIKQYALGCYYPVGIDVMLLTDEEINQTFIWGHIPNKYEEYMQRELRVRKLSRLDEFIRDSYLKHIGKSKDIDLFKIVRETMSCRFEDLLIEADFSSDNSLLILATQLGMKVPATQSLDQYFLLNYLDYIKVGEKDVSDIYKAIEEGKVLQYLRSLTDQELFEQVAFVDYKSRKELIYKLSNLILNQETFFIKLDEQTCSQNVNIAFGKFDTYTIYSDKQLYSTFDRSKGFQVPNSDRTFNLFQINELMGLLQYYAGQSSGLINLITKMTRAR